MKTLTFFLLAVCSTLAGYGRQQVFSNVSLHGTPNRKVISFTLPRVENIRHFRIEASNDSLNFEVVTTISSKGNSVLPVAYHYDVTPYSYKYYRVAAVGMNGNMPRSQVVIVKRELPTNEEKFKPEQNIKSSGALATQQ